MQSATAVQRQSAAGAPLAAKRIAGASLALILGLGLLTVGGFASGDLLHDAAHDGRHSFAFPCH